MTKEELEKENAELKNKLEHRNCLDCSNHSSNLRMRTLELEKGCAKAKEILTKILQRIPDFKANSIKDLSLLNTLSEAEQFIKDSEVEK